MNSTQKIWPLVRKRVEAPLTLSRTMKIVELVDFLLSKLDAGFKN